jgi:cell division GTPase FtsZ
MSNSEFGSISFDLPKNQSNVIKVIGVGGGGSAINHMFKQGIKELILLFVILILKHYKTVQCQIKFSWV